MHNNAITKLHQRGREYVYLGTARDYHIYGTEWSSALPGTDGDHIFIFAMKPATGRYAPLGFADYRSRGWKYTPAGLMKHAKALGFSKQHNQMIQVNGFPPEFQAPSRTF